MSKTGRIGLMVLIGLMSLTGCNKEKAQVTPSIEDFPYMVDQFYDLGILRYRVPGFEDLTLQQKTLVYYLSEAALWGRDIIADQNCRYNLRVRRLCETIYEFYAGDKDTEEWKKFELYLKRVWFSNGIHHHYSEDKFLPECSREWFVEACKQSNLKEEDYA